MNKIFSVLFIVCMAGAGLSSQPAGNPIHIKVACLGNSVTYGLGLKLPETESYPARLAALLGEKYEVRNYGKNGVTLLSKGHNPYLASREFRQAVDYQPDFLIIDLGLNDTDPRNWPNYGDDFIRDYQKLIDSFTTSDGKKPKVYICLMTPVFPGHPRFKSGTRDWFFRIQDCIRKAALNAGAILVDLHTPLYRRPDLFTDSLHPDAEGAAMIAGTIFSAITGDYGGFRLAPIFGEHMVIQQKKPVPLYGFSNSGDKIEAWLGSTYRQTITGINGQWKITMPSVPAGGPYSLRIKVNDVLKIDWKNILSGEVWICSGQSNMEFELKLAENGIADVADANDPGLKLFNYQSIIKTGNFAFDKETLGKINRLEFFKGNWQGCTPETTSGFSAIAYYFGVELRKKLRVPVGLVQVAVGGAPVESFIDRKSLEHNPILVDEFLNREKNDFIFEWVRQRIAGNNALSNTSIQRHPYDPAYIFESGIAPLGNFPVSGIIWYQGESNAHNTDLYRVAFSELIRSWRYYRNENKLPVIVAQLSGIDRPSWPAFRNLQRQLAETIPYTWLVVTSDLGDSLNVHPAKKRQIGERFALQALHEVYQKKTVAEGPAPLMLRDRKEKPEVLFRSAQPLKTSDGKLIRELEIAGEDGIFREAAGQIKRKKIILDTSGEITAVRYGWKPFTRGNLVNKANLPSPTFLLTKNLK